MHKDRKNILFLIPTFAEEGGTQKMVYELGRILSERHNVYECSYDALGEPHVFKNSNPVLTLDSPHQGSLLHKLTSYPRKVSRLRRLKKQYKIDVTISNLWSADLVNALSKKDDKIISIGHISILGNFQNRLLLRFRALAKFVYAKFDKVIAVNEALMRELRDLFDLPAGKVGYINNFIAFPQEQAPAREPGCLRIVNVGRLNPIKNQEPLLRVLAHLKPEFPGLQLVFVGNGPLERELKERAVDLGLRVSSSAKEPDADVIFTGFVDPYSQLWGSDIFVFPSRSEGLPLVVIEAMYTSLPVVASDCPTGGPHVVLEGQGAHDPGRKLAQETGCGYLMPIPEVGDEATLGEWERVVRDLLLDEEKRLRMGAEARRRSLDFSVERAKGQWFATIDGVLGL